MKFSLLINRKELQIKNLLTLLLQNLLFQILNFYTLLTHQNYITNLKHQSQTILTFPSYFYRLMNKSNRQYERGLTTNAFNQDFIYYKYSKEMSKSPQFKKQSKIQQLIQNPTNNSKILSMKNTLNTLFDPLNKGPSKSFHKSVAEYEERRKTQIPKGSKSVFEDDNDNGYYNNKLQTLTSKLREIAEKPHFSTIEDTKKQKSKVKTAKTKQESYVPNSYLINKSNLTNQHLRFQQLFIKQPKNKSQATNNKNINISLSQLARSKSKILSSFEEKNKSQLNYSNSQSSSLKRQPNILKNENVVTIFQSPLNQFEVSQRPRGKTATHLAYSPLTLDDMEPTKIKINSFVQNKQSSKKLTKENTTSAFPQPILLQAKTLTVLQPHRGPINSIIINSDGKRFLTASNDYTIKQSTLDGRYSILRKHDGKINVMRMIDEKLFTGGNDCKLKCEKGNFLFHSPILDVYPHEKQYLNVGTSSSVELFNVFKKVSQKKIPVKTHFYKLNQKLNKDIYFLDNHTLSVIDWRVPFPLINLYQQEKFVEDWVSDPETLDFYQIRDQKLIFKNNTKSITKQYNLGTNMRDYCWKRDKVYFLTERDLQVFESKKNELSKKVSYSLNESFNDGCKLQIKNNIWTYGTLEGKMIINQFE